MKRLFYAVIGSLLCVAFARAQPPTLIARALPAIWEVLAPQFGVPGIARQGSGVMVAQGRIVTNCHVTAGAEHLIVKNAATGRTLTVAREAYDTNDDLCLLVVHGTGFVTLPVEQNGLPPVGTEVLAIGYPLLHLSHSNGTIVSETSVDGRPVLHTTTVCKPGSSGGPLLNERGDVVGINTYVTLRPRSYRPGSGWNSSGCNAVSASLIANVMQQFAVRPWATVGTNYFEIRASAQ